MLRLRYYLHKFFPWHFDPPQVLMSSKKVIREAGIVSALYQLECMDKNTIESFLKTLQYEGISFVQGYWQQHGQEFRIYAVSIRIPGEYLERLQTIPVPLGLRFYQTEIERREEMSILRATIKDWEP